MKHRRLLRPLATLAVLAAAALVAATAGARPGDVVLTFDNLNTGGPGGAGALVRVNTQFASQGVTFNNPPAVDYAKGPFAIPGFARSGSVALEPCVGVEFCTSPLAATFTTPQRRVKVWVGFNGSLAQPLGVQMRAFDAANAVVGTATATFPPSPSPTPIRTPLEVTTGADRITRLEVTLAGGFNNGLAVDDVEFTAAGPPPPCNATDVPLVRMDLPRSGLEVHNDEFILQGLVDGRGAPIESATIRSDPQQGPAREGSLFPVLVRPEGGAYGPIRYGGLLAPGAQKIFIRATNCKGVGVSREAIVTLIPIPQGTRFVLRALEVVQTVQDTSNSVTLIASTGTDVKRTFVRAHLTATGPPGVRLPRIRHVTGMLTASRENGSPAPGPLSVASLDEVTVDPAATFQNARSFFETSLNFELPPEWLRPGRLHLAVTRLAIEGRETITCRNCDNVGARGPIFVTFHRVPPLELHLVSVPYTIPPSPTIHAPRQKDLDFLESWLGRAYPVGEVNVTRHVLNVRNGAPATCTGTGADRKCRPDDACDTINAELADFAALQGAQPPGTRFYGLVHDNGSDNFMRGCAEIGGTVGSGPAGSGTFGWDNDGSYADWYGGHEIAHMFGRLHPGYCDNNSHDDGKYPYLGGLIGNAVFDKQGLDVGDLPLDAKLTLKLYDWRKAWADVMTYCDRQWMSDYTYRGILANLCDGDPANCPNQNVLGGTAPERVPAAARATGFGLAVAAKIDLRPLRARVESLRAQAGLVLTRLPRSSPYHVVLLDGRSRVLADYPVQPRRLSEESRAPRLLVNAVVPFRPATRRVVLTHEGRRLLFVPVSATPPRVRLVFPNGGQRLGRRVTVRWTSSDRERNPRTYALLYSPDGRRWIVVATRLRTTRYTVDLAALPGGRRARFRVVASDGVRTGLDSSDRGLRVAAKPPRVGIVAPATRRVTATAGRPLTFIGSVEDVQDRSIARRRLVWRSSRQGLLGRGISVTRTLRAGVHTITFTATNSAGARATASIRVTVVAVPPRLRR